MAFKGTEKQLQGYILAEMKSAFPGGLDDSQVEKMAKALSKAMVKWITTHGKGAITGKGKGNCTVTVQVATTGTPAAQAGGGSGSGQVIVTTVSGDVT